jgi:hypothetical protein
VGSNKPEYVNEGANKNNLFEISFIEEGSGREAHDNQKPELR